MSNDNRIDSVLLAKYIIQQSQKRNITDMSIVKLQKLLYALDGFLLAKENLNIIDENCRAWKYGPVYPNVFRKIDESDIDKNYEKLDISEIENHKNFKEVKNNVQDVLNNLGDYPATTLSAWSHLKGSPWSQTKFNKIVDKSLIKEYFYKNYFKN